MKKTFRLVLSWGLVLSLLLSAFMPAAALYAATDGFASPTFSSAGERSAAIQGPDSPMQTKSSLRDVDGHWAQATLSRWIEDGLVNGYDDGTFRPNEPMTRAEFVALVNRIFGFAEQATVPFADVASRHWFSQDAARAVAAGYISGFEDNTFRPNQPISRQEAAVILQRILDASKTSSASAAQFRDMDSAPVWSRDAIAAVAENGYMGGYPDGTFRPAQRITRAEAMVSLDRAAQLKPVKAGAYGGQDRMETINGNVVITSPGVTLQHVRINGDLWIAQAVGEGEVTLKGIEVKGTTRIHGGGVNSIYVISSALGNVIVDKPSGMVRIVGSEAAQIEQLWLESEAIIELDGSDGAVIDEVRIAIDVATDEPVVTLIGDFAAVIMETPNVTVQLQGGTVGELTVNDEAKGAKLILNEDARVDHLVLNARAEVTGSGQVAAATVNANDAVFEKEPQTLEVADHVTSVVIGGKVREQTPAGPSNGNNAGSGAGPGGGSGGGGSDRDRDDDTDAEDPQPHTAVYDQPGTYGPASGVQQIAGNAVIHASGVELRNLEIAGDLLVDAAVGGGLVVLDNVIVKGKTVARAQNLTLEAAEQSELAELVLEAPAKVRGTGTIRNAEVKANGSSFEQDPENLVLADGVLLDVAVVSHVKRVSLTEGETKSVYIALNPADAVMIRAESADPDVAVAESVYGSQFNEIHIKGIWIGSATVTIEAEAEGYRNGIETIEVVVGEVPVSEVTVDPEALVLFVGEKATLNASVIPANATFPELNWTSSDAGVATVDANGQVEAISAGTAVIAAAWVYDESKYAASTVTVIKRYLASVSVDGEDLLHLNIAVEVDNGTTEGAVKALLPKTAVITDHLGQEYTVDLTWTIKDYDRFAAGNYQAVGTLAMPEAVAETETPIEIPATVKVKRPTIRSVVIENGDIGNLVVQVENGTEEEDAIRLLPEKVKIIDSAGGEAEAGLAWTIAGYNGSVAGEYTASGVYTVPDSLEEAGESREIRATVMVKRPTIQSVAIEDGDMDNIVLEVIIGTEEEDAIGLLPAKVKITDSAGGVIEAGLTWTIENYNGSELGTYEAAGVYTVPETLEEAGEERTVSAIVVVTPLEWTAFTEGDASSIVLEFDSELASLDESQAEALTEAFTVLLDGSAIGVTSVTVNPDNQAQLLVGLERTVPVGNLTISYTPVAGASLAAAGGKVIPGFGSVTVPTAGSIARSLNTQNPNVIATTLGNKGYTVLVIVQGMKAAGIDEFDAPKPFKPYFDAETVGGAMLLAGYRFFETIHSLSWENKPEFRK